MIVTRHSIPRIIIKKRFWAAAGILLMVLLLIVSVVKSCAGQKESMREYALETVSEDFKPLVSQVLLRTPQGEQINTQLLYAVYITLFDNSRYPDKSNVRERLIKCFYREEKDTPVPFEDTDGIFERIELEFGPSIDSAQRKSMIGLSTELAPGYVDSVSLLQKNLKSGDGLKNNIGLANFAWNALACKSGYVYGAVGQTIRMPFLQKQQQRFDGVDRADLSGEQVNAIYLNFGGRPGFDCSGLIKAYCWLDESTGEISAKRQGALPDCTADGLFESAEVKGDISAMPDTPGLAVHRSGHIGVYVGGGEVIEARGNRYGVVKTELAGRGWEHYLQVPTLTYVRDGTYRIQDRKVVLCDGKIEDAEE